MKLFINISLLFLLICLASCRGVKQSSKREFVDGFYVQKINDKKREVYIHMQDDVLRIYPVKLENGMPMLDSTGIYQFYQKEMGADFTEKTAFNKYSLDIDFLTMPLKYRPQVANVPAQLNTNLNGALYMGIRTDSYKIKYIKNPLKKSVRDINHYGLSLGLFTGLGSTAVTPTTTSSAIAIEYDGVVWNKGLAGIIAVNNFTVGLAVGLDNLMDTNRKYWVYESKPWFGLAFGLNLN